jgi:hypothetical protein
MELVSSLLYLSSSSMLKQLRVDNRCSSWQPCFKTPAARLCVPEDSAANILHS